jgi:hypothetical protein
MKQMRFARVIISLGAVSLAIPAGCPILLAPHSCQSVCACENNSCSVPNGWERERPKSEVVGLVGVWYPNGDSDAAPGAKQRACPRSRRR